MCVGCLQYVSVYILFYSVSQALQDKVHSKIFRTKKPKAFVNGVADRTQKRLAFYFKPLPRTLTRDKVINDIQLYGSCTTKVYQDVDNEVHERALSTFLSYLLSSVLPLSHLPLTDLPTYHTYLHHIYLNQTYL